MEEREISFDEEVRTLIVKESVSLPYSVKLKRKEDDKITAGDGLVSRASPVREVMRQKVECNFVMYSFMSFSSSAQK